MEYSEAFGLDNNAFTNAEQKPQMGQIKNPALHEPADLTQASTSSAIYDNNVQSEAQTSQQQVHPRTEVEIDNEYEVPSMYMNNDENIYQDIDDMEMETREDQDMDDNDDIYDDTES